jgi:hypothetical protein
MVADVSGLESDTKLIRRGRRGECRGESRAACLFDRRLYGGSELTLLLMSPMGNLLQYLQRRYSRPFITPAGSPFLTQLD